MLTLTLGGTEYFDEESSRFLYVDAYECRFEHSLKAMSEWESEFKKPLLQSENMSPEEFLAYIKHMALDEFDMNDLTIEHIQKIQEYNNDGRSATTVSHHENQDSSSNPILTSELLYAYLVNAQIPFEVENWHLSRVIKLLDVIGALQSKDKKMNMRDQVKMQKDLNRQRLAQQAAMRSK